MNGSGRQNDIIAASSGPTRMSAGPSPMATTKRLVTVAWACVAVLWTAGCMPGQAATDVPGPTFVLLPTASAGPTPAAPVVSPAPLPTPGPTPTPVVHVVQSGETLIGIATRYGVSVEDILAVNPGIQAELLQPGQQLIIPLAVPDGGAGLLPTPTPVPLSLGPVACYETPAGSRWCFLEATNPGSSAVEGIAALVTLVAPNGESLASDVATSAVRRLLPGESAPLVVWFAALDAESPHPDPSGAVAQLISAVVQPDSEARFAPVQVLNEAAIVAGRRATVSGRLAVGADATPAVTTLRLVLTIYNQAGLISGMRQLALDGGFAPGWEGPFEIFASALAGTPARYRLTVEAQY